jgi:hypothetical protein
MAKPPSSKSSPDKPSSSKRPSNSSANQPEARSSAAKRPKPKEAPALSPASPSSAARRREPQRQGIAQRQRPQRYGRRRSNRGLWFTLGGVLVAVVGVIVLFIYLGAHQSSGSPRGGYPVSAADPTVVKELTTVDPAVLARVGSGQVQTKPTRLSGASLLTGPTGKPEVFYQGAEYCPYCAAQRWALIVALSRFGSFSNLHQTTSSSTDVYPNTHTFSFYQSAYTSQYIDFVPLEQESYQGVALQTPTAAQQQLINQYNPGGGYPFIDIANKYTVSGASYDPQVLSNLDWQSIAAALSNPQSPAAQGILGAANYLTAAICEATNQQPASVCQAAPIPQLQQALNASTGSSGLAGALLAAAPASRSPRQFSSGAAGVAGAIPPTPAGWKPALPGGSQRGMYPTRATLPAPAGFQPALRVALAGETPALRAAVWLEGPPFVSAGRQR